MKLVNGKQRLALIVIMFLILTAITVSCTDDKPRPSQRESQTGNSQQATSPVSGRDPESVWKQFLTANFAGDLACAECHRKEYEAHQRSGHSHTSVLMSKSNLAGRLAQMSAYEDPRRDQRWLFAIRDDQFTVQDETHPTMPALSVSWLLGSGTHAQTAIAVDEQRR